MRGERKSFLKFLAAGGFIVAVLTFVLLSAQSSTKFKPAFQTDDEKEFEAQRHQMVERQLKPRGISDPLVLEAMGQVPRHLFIPVEMRRYAYRDGPLPIGREQTISQPFIVALMTQLAETGKDSVVLEVGTGSGYQAAVLAEIGAKVFSIEIDCVLAERARRSLEETGYGAVVSKCGDGYDGWPEHAPFDAVLVTAAAPTIPQPLKDQLKIGGVMVIPVGREGRTQVLKTITRTTDGFEERSIEFVVFVPMTGKVQKP